MIFFFLGGIGSGKSVSAVHEIIENKQFVYTNFDLHEYKDYQRLRVEDIIIKDEKNPKKYAVNWEFWENARKEHKSFSIYLDEIHYLIGARNFMSGRSKAMGIWVSQIRKIFSDNIESHLVLITQRLKNSDIIFRDLAHAFILCSKLTYCNEHKLFACPCTVTTKDVYIRQFIFTDAEDLEYQDEHSFRNCQKDVIYANPYFKYYRTDEIIFKNAEIYL